MRGKPGFEGWGALAYEGTLPGTHFVRTLAGPLLDKQPVSVRQVLAELRRKPGFDGWGALTDEVTLPGTHFVRTLAGPWMISNLPVSAKSWQSCGASRDLMGGVR